MDIDIVSGEYRVYATGSVVGVIDEPIVFKIQTLEYEIVFKNDLEKPEAIYHHAPVGDKKRIITIINFNGATGNGVTKPFHVGNINSDKLYLSFIIYTIAPTSGKLMHYTWYLKAKGGENGG